MKTWTETGTWHDLRLIWFVSHITKSCTFASQRTNLIYSLSCEGLGLSWKRVRQLIHLKTLLLASSLTCVFIHPHHRRPYQFFVIKLLDFSDIIRGRGHSDEARRTITHLFIPQLRLKHVCWSLRCKRFTIRLDGLESPGSSPSLILLQYLTSSPQTVI